MTFEPSPKEYAAYLTEYATVPVALQVPFAGTTPQLFQALEKSGATFFLDSAKLYPGTARYSICVTQPDVTVAATREQVWIQSNRGAQAFEADPFDFLQQRLDMHRSPRLPNWPPFVGGWVGFFGFDVAQLLETLPQEAVDDMNLPDIAFGFFKQAWVLDHETQILWIIQLGSLEYSYSQLQSELKAVWERVASRLEETLPEPTALNAATLQATHSQERFEQMVGQAKEHIAAGDIYQANLSQRWSVPFEQDAWALYQRLRQINPSPFATYAQLPKLGDYEAFEILSASPERLVSVLDGVIETRPIAGTRPRGKTDDETTQLRSELLLNEKEQAEHLMLVDLERNDLGRLCEYGTVKVDDFMAIEEYSHVIHIVSNVVGQLKKRVSMKEIAKAVFPGGTITGCPKVRCMEIIDALEPVRRQLYTGSLGYMSVCGNLDWNILIRTAWTYGDQLYFQTGAGIVADSDPKREYEETLHKAQALMEAFVSPEEATHA